MSGLFSLDKVKISYGKNEIVHGVSMDITSHGMILGENGEKMSKSRGNEIGRASCRERV